MLEIFNRDKSYFQTLRDNGIYIDSYNIDTQYDSLINYINNRVVPEINSIISGVLPGINGSPNFYLSNVGDGTTQWLSIDKSIKDYSLQFSKLVQANVASVLVTNGFGELTTTATDTADQVMISQKNNVPIWRKILTNNIADRSITGDDVADHVIGAEHLKEDITTVTIDNNSIAGNHFADNSITAEKFLNSSITIPKLGIINHPLPKSLDIHKAGIIERNHIKNGVITPDKFQIFSIDHTSFNKVACLTKGKIAAQAIDELKLRDFAPSPYPPGDIKYSITSKKLHPDFRLTREKLVKSNADPYNKVVCVYSKDFTQEVYQAFASKGCTGDV